jgi:hypothetical protein
MLTFDVLDFAPAAAPAAPGGWAPAGRHVERLDVASALAAVALGRSAARQRHWDLLLFEVDVVARLLDLAPGGPLRRRPDAADVAAGLRRLCAESIGLAVAARLAAARHGWDPVDGWPVDLDLVGLGPGARPDLLFPTACGVLAGEARGRSDNRRAETTAPHEAQVADLAARADAHGVGAFLAWAWSGDATTRVDHFAVRPPQPPSPPGIEAALVAQAERLFDSAVAARVPFKQVGGERRAVRGTWFRPLRCDVDVFVGVVDPRVVAAHARDRLAAGARPPTRTGGAPTRLQALAGTLRRQHDGGSGTASSAVVGPVVTIVRTRSA